MNMHLRRVVIALGALAMIGWGTAQSFEVGAVLDQRGAPGGYVYITTDIPLAYSAGTKVGLWFSPSAEITFSTAYLDFWTQAQFLVDTSWATLSVRAKYEHKDTRNDWELRVGVLLGQ